MADDLVEGFTARDEYRNSLMAIGRSISCRNP